MKSKSWIYGVAIGLLAVVIIVPSIVLGKDKNNNNQQAEPPTFQDVSVHDPSIIKVDDTYYIFGSHIEAAKSTDLMNWTSFTNGYSTPDNVIYGDLSNNLAGSFAWAGENDSDSTGGFAVWAPEIFWNEHYKNGDGSTGAYMMYYSASSTYIRSAIGFAVSKKIEGPYMYGDTIVYSGFTKDEDYDMNSEINKAWTNTNINTLIDNGSLAGIREEWFNVNGTYNNSLYPNAIDANLFYDHDGKLWMTYGSWSGGIFLLELDKSTGRPIYPDKDGVTEDGRLIDRYFGVKIAGGYTKSGEGPYVVYDKVTDYYHLYMTYGWLGAEGGYNMRFFRAKSPEGPFLDAQGQNAVLPGETDNSPYGNKIMGNFLFERMASDPGTGIGYGYVSSGHNSVYYDDSTGQKFLVFHTRFPQQGEMHEVRVHQLFMNKHGWPVAAPFRYAGEKLEKVNRQEIIGEYKFINHGKDYSMDIAKSAYIRLDKNNKITGKVSGTWKITGHNQAELVMDDKTYDGVFVRQWDDEQNDYVMTFTVASMEGVAVWGGRVPDKTDEEIVADVYAELNVENADSVVSDLSLPTEGTRNTTITWETSNPGVVSETGVIQRPEAGSDSVSATLTAVITRGDATAEKSFTITVLPHKTAGLAAHYTFEDNLGDTAGRFDDGTPTGDRIDNTGTIAYAGGKIGKAAVFDGASGVRLPNGLIQSDAYSVALWVKPEKLTPFTTTFFGAMDNNHWVSVVPSGPVNSNTMVWSGSTKWYDAVTGMTINTGEWTHLAFTVEGGTIKLYVNGTEKFKGTDFPHVFTSVAANFSLGVNWWDVPFQGLIDELRVYEGALSSVEIASLALIEE